MEVIIDVLKLFAFIITITIFVLINIFAIIDKYHREKLKTQIEIDKQMLYNQKEFQVFLASLPKTVKEKSETIQ